MQMWVAFINNRLPGWVSDNLVPLELLGQFVGPRLSSQAAPPPGESGQKSLSQQEGSLGFQWEGDPPHIHF